MDKKNGWFAIVNPNSGKGQTRKNWPNLYQILLRNHIDIEYVYTSHPGEGSILAQQAEAIGFRKIIAVGGDGTVNEVLNGLIIDDKLIYEDTQLAILEHGTGSDFVRSFQQKKGIDNFVKLLNRNKKIKVDLGKIDFIDENGDNRTRYFINALNVGIGAEVVDRVNNSNKTIGNKLKYFTTTITTLMSFNKIDAVCRLENNEIIENRFCGIIISNGQYIGGGMRIAPQAQTDDGLFDIVFIKDITRPKLFAKFPTIYLGRHINLPEIAVYRSSKITIQTQEKALFEADGETLGYSPFSCTIVPETLTLMI